MNTQQQAQQQPEHEAVDVDELMETIRQEYRPADDYKEKRTRAHERRQSKRRRKR